MNREIIDGWIRGRIVTDRELLEGGAVLIEGGMIKAIERSVPDGVTPVLDLGRKVILPGFVELHVHGALGHDFASSSSAELATISSWLARQGVVAYVAAIVSSPTAVTEAAIDRLVEFGRQPTNIGPSLIGILLEGPFLADSRRGAHRREDLKSPDSALLRHYLARIPEPIRPIVALAPELPGADEMAEEARRAGAIVALGHTNADGATATRAIDAGARYAVHLWNAMPPLHHRAPGTVGAALAHPDCVIELIPDLLHIHPTVLRLSIRLAGPDRVALVTDATGPTGLPPGHYTWEGRPVIVDEESIRLEDGTLAGSSLDGSQLVRNVRSLGHSWQELAQMRSETPASVLELHHELGRIQPGRPAHLTMVSDDGEVKGTLIGGRLVYR